MSQKRSDLQKLVKFLEEELDSSPGYEQRHWLVRCVGHLTPQVNPPDHGKPPSVNDVLEHTDCEVCVSYGYALQGCTYCIPYRMCNQLVEEFVQWGATFSVDCENCPGEVDCVHCVGEEFKSFLRKELMRNG